MPTKVMQIEETAQQTLVAHDDERTAIAICNLTETVAAMAGDAVIYISDDDGVTTGKGYAIPPKGYFVIEFNEGFDPRKKYVVISDTAATFVSVFESFLKSRKELVKEPTKEDIQNVPQVDPSM